ncbi:DNA-directed RNA polymerase [Segatella salivae]|nr:DNA-directed RNA polymerase [Segatella salivae]
MNHATNNKSTRISQRCKRCTFDSPGLPNDSAGYPGLRGCVGGTTL